MCRRVRAFERESRKSPPPPLPSANSPSSASTSTSALRGSDDDERRSDDRRKIEGDRRRSGSICGEESREAEAEAGAERLRCGASMERLRASRSV